MDDEITASIISATSSNTDRSIISNFIVPFLWKCGIASASVITLIAGLLYAKQDSLLYFPTIGDLPRRTGGNPRRFRSPAEWGIPFESHMIRCEDGISIHSWLLLHPNSKQQRLPTILYFHGNAGNIGLRLPNAFDMFKKLNANILMVEYRGYGDSDDTKPNEAGLKLDSEAALRFILSHSSVDPGRIFLFGRSLGGAVAFHLANYAEKNKLGLAGIMVENTFLSISTMVDHLMPLVAPFKPLVLRIGWDSSRIAKSLRTPILYLAGDADTLVPHSHMKALHKISNNSGTYVKMHIIHGGTHNESWQIGGDRYYQAMKNFMSETFSMERSNSFIAEHDDWANKGSTKVPPVAVGMGMEIDSSGVQSAIPIMPGNLVGMAKAASTGEIPKQTGKKKD
mmetsp:Transcript_14774/g.21705  ORF Transcript_14774/g.21705 Transcript_14774/m.21705 type:complete len:396 (-) Transcript_14774:615-1802(-)